MTWKKPPGGDLPNESGAFAPLSFALACRPGVSRRARLAEGSLGALFPPTHLAATPSAELISETSTWPCSFERTSR